MQQSPAGRFIQYRFCKVLFSWNTPGAFVMVEGQGAQDTEVCAKEIIDHRCTLKPTVHCHSHDNGRRINYVLEKSLEFIGQFFHDTRNKRQGSRHYDGFNSQDFRPSPSHMNLIWPILSQGTDPEHRRVDSHIQFLGQTCRQRPHPFFKGIDREPF